MTRPVNGEVVDYQDFTGRLEAVKTVEIRAKDPRAFAVSDQRRIVCRSGHPMTRRGRAMSPKNSEVKSPETQLAVMPGQLAGLAKRVTEGRAAAPDLRQTKGGPVMTIAAIYGRKSADDERSASFHKSAAREGCAKNIAYSVRRFFLVRDHRISLPFLM